MSVSAMQIDKLDGDNFSSWSVQMRSLLVTLDHWHVVAKVKDESLNAAEKALWDKVDAKALAMITLCVKPSELIHLKGIGTSKAAWEKLRSTYNGTGPARKVNLFKQLVKFQFKVGQKFNNQINEFCSIVDALSEINVRMPDDLVSILLLCSLPEELENFIVAIESRDVLPTLSQLKVKILEEEHRRSERDDPNEKVFSVKQKEQRVKNNNQISAMRNTNNRSRKNVKCYGCGMRGHVRSQCKNQNQNQAHAVVLSACSQGRQQFKNNNWILDSGASSHMCSDKKLFSSLKKYNQKVFIASGENVEASGIGEVNLKSFGTNITLSNVLFVPVLNSNFLSVSKIIKNGCRVQFADNKAYVNSVNNELILIADLQNGIYLSRITPKREMVLGANENGACVTWHKRFGHLNIGDLCKLSQKEMVRGLVVNKINDFKCVTCALCKISTKPFNHYNSLFTSSLLEVVHTDICGPFRVTSQGGSTYLITFIDDFSRFITVYFLKKKSDALNALKDFVTSSEKQTGKKVKCIRSDNGREYTGGEFEMFLRLNGIIHQKTTSYTPQQNGVAERANRTLIEMARCMLEESGLPQFLWSEAINTAAYIRNRSPTKILIEKTPYECWFGYKPSVSHIRIFGCDAIVLLKKPGRSKLVPKGKMLSFVGYAENTKGYRLYDKHLRSIVISRDVTFFEENFSGARCEINNKTEHTNHTFISFPDDDVDDTNDDDGGNAAGVGDVEVVAGDVYEDALDEADDDAEDHDEHLVVDNDQAVDNDEVVGNDEAGEESSEKRNTGRRRILRTGLPGRPRKVRACIADREVANGLVEIAPNPNNVKEALQCANSMKWRDAMNKEYSSLVENNTWDLVNAPNNQNIIGCKWVFTTKRNADGDIEKYKARLVAQGCFQKENVDYFETYAPVVRHPTIRLILALAVQNKYFINHIDIAAAYLNGDLEEEVYMRQPEEFVDPNHPHKVCKLKKSLYGLKQAGRDWNKKINEILNVIGFVKCRTDSCVYVLRNGQHISIIGLYVDDLIIAYSTKELFSNIMQGLSRHVEAVDRGPIRFYLGMEIEREGSRGSISVHQKRYVEDLLTHWGMEKCKPANTPLASGVVLEKCSKSNCAAIQNVKEYQSLMGGLNYLAIISRPDLAHVVSKMSQFSAHPHIEHFTAAKHILRYIRSSSKVSLIFNGNKDFFCYTDADWGSDTSDRRSYSGHVVFFGGGPVAWESKKQHVIALSTMEAEYIAMCQGTKEVIFIRSLIAEIGFSAFSKEATPIFCDNQGANFFAKNETTQKRSKHIDIRYHFLKEKYSKNIISISYIPSNDNIADIFTKCLNKNKHVELSMKLFKT